MSDIVSSSMDEVTFDDLVSLSYEEGRILDFEWFFPFLSFVFFYDLIGYDAIIHDHVVELSGVDIFLDSIYEVDHFHIRRLTTFGHSIADIDDLRMTPSEGSSHTDTEEIRDECREKISRSEDDIVCFEESLLSVRIQISYFTDEPGIDDILVDIMGSREVIFRRDIDIFLSDDLCSIFESYREVDIFERHGDDSPLHIEHLRECLYRFFVVLLYVDKGSEEDITNLVPADDTLFILESIFEEFSYHFCIFRESGDSSPYISRREYSIFIADLPSLTTTICDRYDRSYIVVRMFFEASEDIEIPGTTTDSYYIGYHKRYLICRKKTV